MDSAYAAGTLHLVLSSFLLWIVPAQLVFFADLVAFPLSLFFSLRSIVSIWCLKTPAYVNAYFDKKDKALYEQAENVVAETTARKSATKGNQTIKRNKEPIASAVSSHALNNASLAPPASTANKTRCKVPLMRIFMLIAQLVLFAMVLDFVYRPLVFPGKDLVLFRPGYVSHEAAKLHIRYPHSDTLQIRYRTSELNGSWESAGSLGSPTELTDFTTTIDLVNLRPSTRYQIELLSSQSTVKADSVLLGTVEFKTAPRPHSPTRLRFGSGSCIKPNFPYRPTTAPDIYGFASMLEHSNDLDMIIFMGDFIYADVPLYFGTTTEDYRRLYRQVYMAKSSRRLMRRVPMLHIYDDHEIKNNWHNQEDAPMGNAMTAFNEYNGAANPPSELPGRSYYNFTHGNIAFYAWDTRRYRTQWEDGSEQNKGATMLGAEQKRDFVRWLSDVNHTAAVKFVISSVPLTTGWSNFDASQDTWRGYPTERSEILALTKHVPNLFFLSGDRHEMAAVELPSGNIEFSTSPISQFTFPFIGKFRRDINGEKTLHYRRPGHVKYGIIDVDTETDPDIPRIKYSLFTNDVDHGHRPAWTYEAKGMPWA